MKVLVLSDSHSGLSFMRRCIDVIRPDAMVHLGDYFDDGQTMAEAFPHIPMHQVPGNCDRNRLVRYYPEVICYDLFGAKIYMTHGHMHFVKQSTHRLLRDARELGAKAVLFGHTHCAVCYQEKDGLWVLNPGSCGSYGGSVGLMEICEGTVMDCKILHTGDLEEML